MKCFVSAIIAGLTMAVASPAAAKPLKVFILAGQSNMQGHANVSTLDFMADDPKTAPILQEMRNADGTPRVCQRVWISSVGCAGDGWSDVIEQTGKLTTGFGASPSEIGPELTFGIYIEKALREPILLIKTAWGGRSLHTDFRPPSAGPYLWGDFELARRQERHENLEKQKAEKIADTGVFYRHMIEHVKKVLADVKRVAPEYDPQQGCELAGFVWFQGWNDLVSTWTYPNNNYEEYGRLLEMFIRDVRKDLSAPRMPFVIGVIGVGGERAGPDIQELRRSQVTSTLLPEFEGNVTAVQTAPYWDDELDALQQRREKLNDKVDRETKKDPNLAPAAKDEANKKALAETFTSEELKRLKGISNGGYHYLGAAKILAPIGKAFAEAMADFQRPQQGATAVNKASQVTLHSEGLHGYIGFGHEKLPAQGGYSAGMGFYAAVWPLVDQPLANFQIGLPSSWIQPDNSDNKDKPLAPEGTLARTWKERGPTWDSVFQTVEGGLGYWAGNHFRYGPPKFSMNGTPQCYDYEVGSPGWSFFYSNEALPDHRLGIAQLSNRLLIPPDALPFQGHPNGEFLGYTWMALPFTDPTYDDPPTGDQSWTCFLSAANFKGPIAYYIPETWSKIGKLFKYPFLYGRGLDARPGIMGGGAMEINTVPRFDATDAHGATYSKLPKLHWPVDAEGRAFLVQDVTYYSKGALYNAFKAWRDGGPACSGRFDDKGAFKPKLNTHTTHYDQAGKKISGVEQVFDTRVFEGNAWGLQWFTNNLSANGLFPQYYKDLGGERVAVPAADVPSETKLLAQEFEIAKPSEPYSSPNLGAWAKPGPKTGPFTVKLTDGSVVTYCWYRFVDQPSFQQYHWSTEKKAMLQSFVERLHADWRTDRDYMAPPTRGKLVALDPALLVTPPPGLEVGYVPIVIRQSRQ